MNVEDEIEEAVISYKTPLPGLAMPNYRTSLPSSTSIKNDGAVIQQQAKLNWETLTPLLALTSQQLGNRKWVGLFSIHRPEKAGYEYKAVPLGFSQEVLAEAAGNTRPFFLEYNKTTSDSTHVYGVFIATIPDSDNAEQQLRKAIMGPAEASQKQIAKAKPIQLSSQDRCWEVISGDGGELDFLPTMCVEIVVTAPRIPFPPIDEIWDDEWGPYDWEPSGGGGSSNGNDNCFIVENFEMRPCEEEEEKEEELDEISPCNLGLGVISLNMVQQKMNTLWNASYGTENSPFEQKDRNESMIFLLDGADGFYFKEYPIESISSCHIDLTGVNLTELENYGVAILHTHPYKNGDIIKDTRCREHNNTPDSVSVSYNAYNVSAGDKSIVSITGLPMYVMDVSDIRVIHPQNSSQYSETINRCWY